MPPLYSKCLKSPYQKHYSHLRQLLSVNQAEQSSKLRETKMTSTNVFPGIQKHIPIMGDMNLKSPIAYKATRLMAGAFNTTQMALAEAYILHSAG